MLPSHMCQVYALQKPEAGTTKAGFLSSAGASAEACHAACACVAQHGADRACAAQGRIVEVRGPDDEARVIYDDGMEEWLALPQERFQWLAPRAQSAGGTPELQVALLTCAPRCCSAGGPLMAVVCPRSPQAVAPRWQRNRKPVYSDLASAVSDKSVQKRAVPGLGHISTWGSVHCRWRWRSWERRACWTRPTSLSCPPGSRSRRRAPGRPSAAA